MMMVVIFKFNIDGLEEVFHERSFDLPDKETQRVTHANAASCFLVLEDHFYEKDGRGLWNCKKKMKLEN